MYDREEVPFDIALASMRQLGQIFSSINEKYVCYRVRGGQLQYSTMPPPDKDRDWRYCISLSGAEIMNGWIEVKE